MTQRQQEDLRVKSGDLWHLVPAGSEQAGNPKVACGTPITSYTLVSRHLHIGDIRCEKCAAKERT